MVMGYTNNTFVEIMDWLYVQYRHITPGYLMQNQEEMQVKYNFNDPIEILFDQIEMGKKFAIAGKSQFSDRQLVDMGVAKILATQEYTHAY